MKQQLGRIFRKGQKPPKVVVVDEIEARQKIHKHALMRAFNTTKGKIRWWEKVLTKMN